MRNRLYSYPISIEDLNKIYNNESYEVELKNHETLENITIFNNDGTFYHLDMLVSDELVVEVNNDEYIATM